MHENQCLSSLSADLIHMRNRLKFFFRRGSESINNRLRIRERKFQANREKLAKAQSEGRELIDIMPGIGMPMVIHPEMYLKIGYTEHIFEPACLHYIRDCLRPGDTFFDVGANVGYFAIFASKIVGPSGRVIAFEPGEFAFTLLSRNRELDLLPCLEIHQAGLGDENTIVPFNCGDPGMEVYSSLREVRHPNANSNMFHKVDIRLFRGDSWAQNNGVEHIDFMKVDVEGGEYLVLKGMAQLFAAQMVSRLLIEITHEMSAAFGYSPSDIISFLRGFGYEWFRLEPFGKLERVLHNEADTDGMFVAIP